MAKHEAQRVLRPSERSKRRSRYVASLDGLRALAVLAVIAYHMRLNWAPGGLMGVTVFFVISGYLITGLLVAEYDASGSISLPQFWLRRVRRIIPAVLVAIAGTLVLCALLNPTLFSKARDDLVPSLLFYNNWWQIFRDLSYFEAAGAPSPLTHYWSLAIEEQFYIIWPLFLLLLLKLRVPKRGIAVVVGVLACASAAEMALLYDPMSDPSRIYYGTDTRAASLLVGSLLAFVWPSTIFGHRRTHPASPAADAAFNLLGVAAACGIVAIIVLTNSYSAFPYHGGIVGVSLLTAVLIMVLVVPYTWVARLFELKPFVWIGKRSYGMYLWHYPIILATTSVTSTIEVPWWVRLAQLVIICAVADLSYRFVETPVRSGALGKWVRARRARAGEAADAGSAGDASRKTGLQRVAAAGTVGVCAVLFAGAAVALAVVPKASPDAQGSATSASGSPPESVQARDSVSSSTASTGAPDALSQAPAPSSETAPSSPSALSSSSSSTLEPGPSSEAGSQSSSARAALSRSSDSSNASAVSEASSESRSGASGSSADASSSSSASAESDARHASAGSRGWVEEAASAVQGQVAARGQEARERVRERQDRVVAQVMRVFASSGDEASGEVSDSGMVAYEAVEQALKARVSELTDDERAQAEEALKGVVERTIEAVNARVDETQREAERQRKQDAYDAIFAEEHYNDAGGMIYEPLLIGDSVAAGCENEFYKAFPNGHSDALVNRNIWESPYDYYAATGQVGDYVVFCLGTNNAVVDEQIDAMLSLVTADKKVILVNIRAPRDWEAQTNKAIADAASRHANVVGMVDWYAESAGHDEYFYEDGIHLNAVGAAAYIGLIQDAIKASID